MTARDIVPQAQDTLALMLRHLAADPPRSIEDGARPPADLSDYDDPLVVVIPFKRAAGKTAFADDFGYVDAHSHLWSSDRTDYPLAPGAKEDHLQPKTFDIGEFFEVARPEGVTRVVGIGHGPLFGTDARYLVDLMKARPGLWRCRHKRT
jgi:hypothetical protein